MAMATAQCVNLAILDSLPTTSGSKKILSKITFISSSHFNGNQFSNRRSAKSANRFLGSSQALPALKRETVKRKSAPGISVFSSASESIPSTQQGWYYTTYGVLDVLQFGNLSVPEINDDQVLIKVKAAGLNPVDCKRRMGKFKTTDSALPTTPGYDVAGVVVKVGENVTKFKVGDEVYSNISEGALNYPKQYGTVAQYTATEEKLVARKPYNLTFIEAAGLPLSLLTAQEAFDRVNFLPNQSALILNGAGGVGTLAIQLARKVYRASHIATTASIAKAPLLHSLGADTVIDYKTQEMDLAKGAPLPDRFDFVLDCIGGGEWALKMAREGGSVAVLTGNSPPPSFRFVVTSCGANLARLTPYFESGDIRPVLDPASPFSFENAKLAFKLVESGRATGKVVIGPIN